jgi:O-antigen/teichoic acid export membrane protein
MTAQAPSTTPSTTATTLTFDRDAENERRPEGSSSSSPGSGDGFQIKGLARHSMVYLLGIILSKAVSFVMLPVYTRFLTPGDYGIMELIEMTLDVISIIAGGGIATGIFRFYHKADTEAERKAVVSTALQFLAATYVVVALGVWFAAPWLSSLVFRTAVYAPLVRIAACTLVFQSLFIAPMAFIRVSNRSPVFVAISLSKLVLSLSFNIYFVVHLRMGARGVLTSNLIANAVIGTALVAMVLRNVGLSWSAGTARSLVRYGIPLIWTQFATFIATFGDRYFLQHVSNVTSVGLYTLAYQFGFILGTVGYMPMELVWVPARFAAAKRPDRDEILARAFIYINVWLLSAAVGLTLFIGDVLHVMTTPAFYPAATYVPLILVAYVWQGWATFLDLGIHMRERTEYITLANWLSAGTALVGYAVLIPHLYALGAAIATAAAFFVRFAATYWFAQRLWPVKYRWTPVVRQVAIGLVVCLASLSMPAAANNLISIGVHALLFVVYLVGLWTLGVLSANERRQAIQFLRRTIDALRPRRAEAVISRSIS